MMLSNPTPDTEELLCCIENGDRAARSQLLNRHRERLKRMIAVHLDRRLAARLDASDVVNEVLFRANQELLEYVQERPLPYYPWLRQLAWDHLLDLRRRHLRAKKRSVYREAERPLSDESLPALAEVLAVGTSPSQNLLRQELQDRVRQALTQLAEQDREILILRHLEQLSSRETAAVLGIGEGAAKMRHLRALQRMRAFLKQDSSEEPQ